MVRFLTWLKVFFGTVDLRLTLRIEAYDSHDTEHAMLECGRRTLSSANLSAGLPGSPE